MSTDAHFLAGVTVLDFTRVLAGPYCTRLFADLGAQVIKVERPVDGDETRRGHLQIEAGRDDQSTYFIRVNVGKLSVAIDLGHPEAPAVVRDLVRASDVVIENFLPGVMAKLGCGYEALASVRPDLVYCSISGFGQTGPLSRWPAFAHIINAMSGIMHLEQQGEQAPRGAYLQAADVLAGTHAFGAICAALVRRTRTGHGAYIDVSMLECLVAAEDVSYGSVLNGGDEYPGPRPGMVLQGIGGRWLALQTVGAAQLWPRLYQLMERPDLADDPRFSTPRARREHWGELRLIIEKWLTGFDTVEQALQTLNAARLPCAPVLSPGDVAAHPQLAARHAFPTVAHASRETIRVTATPFQIDGRPVEPAGPPPYRAGEHTRTVLTEVLGYSTSRVDELIGSGAIAVP